MQPFPQPRDQRTALFGGEGDVFVQDLLGGAAAPPFHAALACELSPGGSVGRHVQQAHDVLLIVLEGEGRARVDDQPVALSAGIAVHVPFGKTLSLTNPGAQPLHYLMVKAR